MSIKTYFTTKNGQRNLRAIGVFLAFYAGLLVFTTLSQERLVYLPNDRVFGDCPSIASFGLIPQSYNGTRFYGPENSSSSTELVVIYHGNAGSACDRSYYLPFVSAARKTAVIVEYAGYGSDPISPSHERIKQDVRNMTAWLQESDITSVTVLGESIGSGPALLHAKALQPENLVLITPFTSLKALAAHHYWYFPTDLLVNNAYNNKLDLISYTGPRTLIHGTEDKIVPFYMSEELAAVAPEFTKIDAIEGADHNNLFSYPAFSDALNTALAHE